MNDTTPEITPSGIVLASGAEAAVKRGREAAYRLQSMVKEYRANGYLVIGIRISNDVANDIRANLAAICDGFDGVLPQHVLQVPLTDGLVGKDFAMTVKKVDQAGNELGPTKEIEA